MAHVMQPEGANRARYLRTSERRPGNAPTDALIGALIIGAVVRGRRVCHDGNKQTQDVLRRTPSNDTKPVGLSGEEMAPTS